MSASAAYRPWAGGGVLDDRNEFLGPRGQRGPSSNARPVRRLFFGLGADAAGFAVAAAGLAVKCAGRLAVVATSSGDEHEHSQHRQNGDGDGDDGS